MATEALKPILPRSQQTSLLDRTLDLSRINIEVVAYITIVVLSMIAHLWGLGIMALHHDESIHAYMSWKFYTGEGGGFTCANGGSSATYCYDPVYHGPSLYVLTLLSYFLFGSGDAQARLPMALAGIGLVASCWLLRPYLGKRGALIAAVLLGFTPALLYYTRFARHDGLMVLWELWIVIGFFRYLDTGRPIYFYLLMLGSVLAIATHELYYIVFFIFGIFAIIRLLSELNLERRVGAVPINLTTVLLAALGICLILMVINPPLPVGQGLYLGDKAFMIGMTLLLGLFSTRVWDPKPVLLPRLVALFQTERSTLWIGLTILVGVYLVLYTTFFAYPPGALDGLYAGLAYWLGSQHEFARGDQPWYYYLMLIPIYEPLGLVCGLGAAIYLYTLRRPSTAEHVQDDHTAAQPHSAVAPQTLASSTTARRLAATEEMQDDYPDRQPHNTAASTTAQENGEQTTNDREQAPEPVTTTAEQPEREPKTHSAGRWLMGSRSTAAVAPRIQAPALLFALLLLFWYVNAIVIFSWAGEKMPWLLVHMALPGNLIAAWVLAQLLNVVASPERPVGEAAPAPAANDTAGKDGVAEKSLNWRVLLVPPAILVFLVAVAVAFWRLNNLSEDQMGQANLLQAVVPLLIAGGLVYALLSLMQRIGIKVLLSVVGLTLAAVVGAYMIRATWLVVYHHPDTPIDPLIYVQTSPDVPRYVRDVREIAVNQTRNYRNVDDVAGGLSMPVVVDLGGDGDSGLTWPMQWYFREFQRIEWRNSEELRTATPQTFEAELPNGTTGPVPVVMLHRANVTEETRNALRENYTRPYGESGVFNWWFPEGDKCRPEDPGYKRFYYNSWTPVAMLEEPPGPDGNGCGQDISEQLANQPPWAPLLWPLQAENFDTVWNYMLYRELPDPLRPGSRDMEVWIRSDLVGGAGGEGVAGGGTAPVALLAQQAYRDDGLTSPTGVAVDSDGYVYVSDTQNHRVLVFDPDGELDRTIGSFGNGEGQFHEPRGLAIDADDNLYVADTWNARIAKLDQDGEWLGAWGEGEADEAGRLATITGGDRESNEANPMGFYGPRGVAVDAQGNVYIADTGNRRIVVTDDEGEYLYQWGYAGSEAGAFNEPTDVDVDDAGNVVVADTWNRRVKVFALGPGDQVSPEPVNTWRVDGWAPNTYDDPAIAISPAGQVYTSVPSRQRMLATALSGETVLEWGVSGDDLAALNLPSGIAVGPDGNVYVVDRGLQRVLQFELPALRQ